MLTGVDAAFLVFPSVAGDAAAAALVEAVTAAVPHVVYLSAYGVPDVPDPEAAADGTILGSQRHVEGLLAAAPGRATFLRASGFAANTLGWAPQIRAGDVLRWFHPDARRALVHEADLAAVAVRCLLGDVPAGGRHHVDRAASSSARSSSRGHRGRARQAAPVRGATPGRGGAGAGRRVPAGAGRRRSSPGRARSSRRRRR